MIDKQKQYKRQNAWNKAHYERLCLDLPQGLKAEWKERAKERGMSLAEFITDCVKKEAGN